MLLVQQYTNSFCIHLYQNIAIYTLVKSKTLSLLPAFSVGVAIWFGASPSDELTPTAIHLLSVFTR